MLAEILDEPDRVAVHGHDVHLGDPERGVAAIVSANCAAAGGPRDRGAVYSTVFRMRS